MSQENVEIVRRVYEVINRFGAPDGAERDRAEGYQLLSFFDPEVELHQHSGLVGTGTYRGYEGLLQAARDLADAFGSVEFVVDRYFDEANFVVTDLHVRATGRISKLEAPEIRIGHVFELRDGRVVRWTVYPNFPDALEAAGLSE